MIQKIAETNLYIGIYGLNANLSRNNANTIGKNKFILNSFERIIINKIIQAESSTHVFLIEIERT